MKLIDHFPSWMTDGIFSKMTWAPWYTTINQHSLDIEYFGNRSGERESSPLVDKMSNQNNTILSTENVNRLISIFQSIYSDNWFKLWDAIQQEYNPIENYDLTEITSPGIITKRSTNTDVETATNVDGTTVGDAFVVPLNGVNPVKVSQSQSITTGDENVNKVKTTGNKDTNYEEITHTGHDELRRHGNIGVTTSQQMLESEYELRKRNYFDYIFECVDNVLTCPYWR